MTIMDANSRNKNFWFAIFSLVGTTIGAGIFSLPFVFYKSGFVLGLIEIILLETIIIAIQLMAGEIALRTRGRKRFLSYAKLYLNKGWQYILNFSIILASIGSILAYLILAGGFISVIFGLSFFESTIVFFVIWFFALLAKARTFGRAEFYLSILMIVLIVFIAIINFNYINFKNLIDFNPANFLLSYGVIIFAITGISVIPEMEEILGDNKKRLKRAIIFGTLIPFIVYLIFVITVVGVSGHLTSAEAILGLAKSLNSRIILIIGAIIGIISVSQAAFSTGIYLKETLWYDLGVNKRLSWALTGALPFLLFLLGIHSFIKVISVIGAVFLGFQMVMILWMHKNSKSSELKPAYEIKLPLGIYWIFGILISFGAVFGALCAVLY